MTILLPLTAENWDALYHQGDSRQASSSRISSFVKVLSRLVGIGEVFDSSRVSMSAFRTVTVFGARNQPVRAVFATDTSPFPQKFDVVVAVIALADGQPHGGLAILTSRQQSAFWVFGHTVEAIAECEQTRMFAGTDRHCSAAQADLREGDFPEVLSLDGKLWAVSASASWWL